jgi:hypothetical protein
VSDGDDKQPDTPAKHGEHGGHAGIHLPPNSWVPINLALALAVLFVGFLTDIRATIGPIMWLVGLVWMIAACAMWVVTARREYLSLPEDQQH